MGMETAVKTNKWSYINIKPSTHHRTHHQTGDQYHGRKHSRVIYPVKGQNTRCTQNNTLWAHMATKTTSKYSNTDFKVNEK